MLLLNIRNLQLLKGGSPADVLHDYVFFLFLRNRDRFLVHTFEDNLVSLIMLAHALLLDLLFLLFLYSLCDCKIISPTLTVDLRLDDRAVLRDRHAHAQLLGARQIRARPVQEAVRHSVRRQS